MALNPSKETHMTQQAIIRGEVCFRAGDGALMPIPPGPVEIELTEESATVSWSDPEGNPGVTAITLDEYERYCKEGKIRTKAE